jgi:hypothetical protein
LPLEMAAKLRCFRPLDHIHARAGRSDQKFDTPVKKKRPRPTVKIRQP